MFEVRGYQLQKRLDRHGSQGFVFKARQLDLDRPVALKIVPDRMGTSASERVLREAQAIARMSSDHVVVVHAYGRGDGFVFMAMEFLDGEDLETMVRRRIGLGGASVSTPADTPTMLIEPGAALEATLQVDPDAIDRAQSGSEEVWEPAPAALQGEAWIERVLDLTSQVLAGLEALHASGIVHSDVKPANIMLNGDRAKLIDFGTSRRGWVVDDHGRLIEGTPGFMAPEQTIVESEPDARTDLFGLGATLFFALTGRAPFQGESLAAVIDRVRHHEPPELRTLNPAVQEPLAAIVRRLLRKRPEERFASAAELRTELDRLRAPPRDLASTPRRSVPGWWFAMLVLLVSFGAWFITRWPQDPDRAVLRQLEVLYGEAQASPHEAWLHVKRLPEDERARLEAHTRTTLADGEIKAIIAAALRPKASVLGIEDAPDCLWYVTPVLKRETLEHVPPRNLAWFDRVGQVRYRILDQGETYAVYLHQTQDRIRDWLDRTPFVCCLFITLPAVDTSKTPPYGPGNSPFWVVRLPNLSLTNINLGSASLIDPKTKQETPPAFRYIESANAHEQRLAVTSEPISTNSWRSFALFLSSCAKDPALVRLFAHPDEPDDLIARLLAENPGPPDMTRPAKVSFWLAFRMCSYLGCHPPSFEEWQKATAAHPDWFDQRRETWLNWVASNKKNAMPFKMVKGAGGVDYVEVGINHPVYGVRVIIER